MYCQETWWGCQYLRSMEWVLKRIGVYQDVFRKSPGVGVHAEVLLCCDEMEAIIWKVSAKQMYYSGVLRWDG